MTKALPSEQQNSTLLDNSLSDLPQAANELLIYLGEHGIVVGSTGSGKTVFTCSGLLQYMQHVYPDVPRYVLDSTSDPDMDKLMPDAIHIEGNHPPDLLHSADRTLIWTPRNSKIPREYAHWFSQLNDARRPAIVIIDEVASITKQALEELEALFKQFRKHGGTVVAETQRIAKVDSDMFSQVSHFWLFRINPEPYDILQARAYLQIPKEEFQMPRNKYGFHYRRTRSGFPAEEFVDYHQFFGNSLY